MLSAAILCASLATAHVQVFYNASQQRPVRNAAGPDGTGRMSVNGPCGGANTWGQNGFQAVTTGAEMWVKIQYNGGHRSPANAFHASWLCNDDGPTNAEMTAIARDESMMLPLLPATTPTPIPRTGGMPLYVNASQGNRVRDGYTLVFNLPDAAMGRCTVSLMDQRRWGGCVDLMVSSMAPTSPPVAGGTMAPTPAPTTPPPPITMAELAMHPYRNTPTSCGDDFPTCCCVYANFTVRAAGSFGGVSWPDYVDADMWTEGTCMWPGNFMMNATMQSYRQLELVRESSGSFVTRNTVDFPPAGTPEAAMLGPNGGEPFRMRVANGTVEYGNEIDDVTMPLGIAFCSGYTSTYTPQIPMLVSSFNLLYTEVQAAWELWMQYEMASTLGQIQLLPEVRSSLASMQAQHDNFTTLYNTLSPYERRFVSADNVTNTTSTFNQTSMQFNMALGNTGSGGGAAGTGGGSGSEGDSTRDTIGIAVGFFVLLALVVGLVALRGPIADAMGRDGQTTTAAATAASSRSRGSKKAVYEAGESTTDVGASHGAAVMNPNYNVMDTTANHGDAVSNPNYNIMDTTANHGDAVSNPGYAPARPPVPAARPPAPAAPSWETLYDNDGTPYYHNTASGETTWDKPAGHA